MKILYYDCFAGISGDMNLGAMIDLGVDVENLRNELSKLPVKGYTIKAGKDIRKGISGTRLQVILDDQLHNHDHDQDHYHDHGHEHHHHDHETEHPHHTSYADIKEMIKGSQLNDRVKQTSISIFEKVAMAESKIHNMPVDEVRFHEVGAIDSIVDIVGAAICLDFLSPDKVMCSTVELGSGMIKCAHGLYPVPAPATAEISRNIPVRKGSVSFEATTPTGAAILAATVHEFSDKAEFTIMKTGHGIGHKDGELPNVLRVFLGDTPEGVANETSWIVECNIDDMNPEYYDYIIDLLFSAGAKDVFMTPIIMKKSRPAVKLSILCTEDSEAAVHAILFRETSTIGTRKYKVDKSMLDRRIETINTSIGEVRIKSVWFKGKYIRSKPEYEDCIRIAREKEMPLNQVYREIDHFLSNNRKSDDPGNN